MKNEFENENTTLVYGKNAVVEILKSDRGVDTVYIADTLNDQIANYYKALSKEKGAVVKQVHSLKLKNMCQTDSHQGVACYASSIEYVSINDLLNISKQKNTAPFIVICDGVEDPHNLGAIIRTSYLMGADGIVIPNRGGASVTPIVYKTSAGASVKLPIARVTNIAETVRKLKQNNIFVYCLDMGEYPLYGQNLTGAIAIVVGNEGKGVSQLVKKLCDGVITIPMIENSSNVDSYNVSVATGISMYEIVRQRNKK